LMMGGVSGPPAGCEPADAEQKQSEPGGSNIFAVAGSRTPDGAALFASDSHGPIAIFGTFFHPARIRAGPVDAFLVDIAGLPIGLKGHGSHFAWGWAEGPRRPADCLVVETSGADGRTFRIDGKPQRLQAEPFRLRIAGSDDVVGAIETSRHNGVRSVVVRREGRRAFIISSAYSGRAGGAARQFRHMLLASDWGAMMKALDAREIYPGNIAIGGPNGGILFARPGRIPVRPAGSSGAAPVSGETSATAWRGIRPFLELVQLRDPAPGYIANANVSPDMMYGQPLIDPAGFPEDFAFEPGRTGTRQRRAIELLETGQPINLEQFLLVVGDANVPGHEGWATALAAARLAGRVESAGAEEEFDQRLLQFDGHFVPQSEGAVAHAAWRLALRASTDPSARAVEQAIAKGELPDEAGLALLLQAARDGMAWLAGTDPQASTFGAVFRTGRGDHDAPARGLTLLPLEGDSGELTDFGSLWSSVYTERAEDGRMVHRSGTRLPFAVHLADPIRSMSHVVQGVDDRPEGRHHSDQAGDYGEAVFRWNHLQAEDLARHLTAARTLV
ncbi:MAG: penicillin acylase family protein, partial [Thermaurantiacus sp.]